MSEPTLKLTGPVHVAAMMDELFHDLGEALMAAATQAVSRRGVFHLALSGGSTPEPFYMRLVTDPDFRALPWWMTHVWMVDERRVPEDHPKSNFKMIRETLVDHVTISKRQVHPMPVMRDDPVTAYERDMAAAFGLGDAASGTVATPNLDFVLLGMGDDGHTASLFPGSPAMREDRRWIAVNDGPGVVPPPRVTMTFPLLNAARQVAVLVTGVKKRATLAAIEMQEGARGAGGAGGTEVGDPRVLPIMGVRPVSGDLTWYLDADAAYPPAGSA